MSDASKRSPGKAEEMGNVAESQANSIAQMQQDSAARVAAAASSSLTKADKAALWKPVIKEIQALNGDERR